MKLHIRLLNEDESYWLRALYDVYLANAKGHQLSVDMIGISTSWSILTSTDVYTIDIFMHFYFSEIEVYVGVH